MESTRVAATRAAETERAADCIQEFCAAHGISRSLLFQLWREGRGPRRMVIGRTIRITREAAAEWRRDVEKFPVPVAKPWTADADARVDPRKRGCKAVA